MARPNSGRAGRTLRQMMMGHNLHHWGRNYPSARAPGIEVFLFDEVRVGHRPYPRQDTDKGAVASVRDWLKQHGVTPS